MARKLASVQRVVSITPIVGADRIELATVRGWKCVVVKGQFQPNDLGVYIEIDSLCPMTEPFEFLKSRGTKKMDDGSEGYKVATIRLKGQISQGLLMPLSAFGITEILDEDTDVTERLGIKLWNPPMPACLKGLIKGEFPSFIPKTDETRVQNIPKVIKRYAGTPCRITEKIDGSSATFYLREGKFGICSRNIEVDIEGSPPENSYVRIAKELDIENKMRAMREEIGQDFAIQGEVFGSAIQDNRLKIQGVQIRFFNVFLIDDYRYLDANEAELIINNMGLQMVPTVNEYWVLESDIDSILKLAEGKSVINPEKEREGIVVRPLVEIVDLEMSRGLSNGRLSFKAISNEYLIKNGL